MELCVEIEYSVHTHVYISVLSSVCFDCFDLSFYSFKNHLAKGQQSKLNQLANIGKFTVTLINVCPPYK